MASIVVAGDTSGSVTLSAPAVAGTTTLTLPTANGTILTSASTITPSDGSVTQAKLATGVAGTGPAFSAFVSSTQGITGSAWVLTPCNSEEFDTAGCYNNTGSTVTLNGISTPAYSFAPNVAGYYQVNASYKQANDSGGQVGASIYKNGSQFKVGNYVVNSGTSSMSVNCLIYLNGTSDYIGFYVYNQGGNTRVAGEAGGISTWFQANLVRGS